MPLTGSLSGTVSRIIPTLHFIVPCNSVPTDGYFDLREPTRGRVDVIARCAIAALFYSNGVRHSSTVSFVCTAPPREYNAGDNIQTHNGILSDVNTVYTLLGSEVQGLRPNENGILAPLLRARDLYRTLRGDPNTVACLAGDSAANFGQLYPPVTLTAKQKVIQGIYVSKLGFAQTCAEACVTPNTLPIYLHGNGTPAAEYFSLHSAKSFLKSSRRNFTSPRPRFVIVIGDQNGVATEQEWVLEELGFHRVSLGSVPLLTSACITIIHHYVDLMRTT
jgi:tRNA pseudouridine-54 N-methylase